MSTKTGAGRSAQPSNLFYDAIQNAHTASAALNELTTLLDDLGEDPRSAFDAATTKTLRALLKSTIKYLYRTEREYDNLLISRVKGLRHHGD